MNEFAIGHADDVNYVISYLGLVRGVKVQRLFPYLWFSTLDEYLLRNSGISRELFFSCLEFMLHFLQENMAPNFEFLPLSRWGVTTDASDEVGGFHSPNSAGYLDYYFFGLGAEPKRQKYAEDLTWELLRSFIHDSIHANCYRSYRMPKSINKNPTEAKYFLPKVYRYQYGINYRMQNGTSFSKADNADGRILNLNLIMDGFGAFLQSSGMRRFAEGNGVVIDEKWELHRDIFGYPANDDLANNFHKIVVSRFLTFREKWRLTKKNDLLGRAMVSGRLEDLSGHLDGVVQTKDVLGNWFRQPSFRYEDEQDEIKLEISNAF